MPSTLHELSAVSRKGPPPADLIRARLARELRDLDEEVPEAARRRDRPIISDHTLLQHIGTGSYGEVWLARSALGTLRAVKIVYRAHFKDERPYEREFQGILKYEPISRTHEGLVQVLHVGRNDAVGCFYYVMELADDANAIEPRGPATTQQPKPYFPRTLAGEFSHGNGLTPARAATLALRLTRAVGHLHRSGLVHRDIKPSNIIFVGGLPKLADIGLIAEVGSSRSFVGTEGFIPPEGPGAPPADLYSLGKVLYELATGRDRSDFPQLPASLNAPLLELNEVITRACAPNLQERYASATELEADLNLFLAGRSLRRARNLERYLARSKRAAALGAVFIALLAVTLWFSRREEQHARETARLSNERAHGEAVSRRKETTLRLRAERAEREKEHQLYTALLEQARATVRSGEPGQRFRALDALRRAGAISNRVELRREAIAALALPDLNFQKEIPLAPEFTLRWLDPTLERIAICRGRGPVEIRSVRNHELLATLPASTNLLAWAGTWSSDGRFLAVKRDYFEGGARADLEVWNVQTVHRILLLKDVRYNARSFHPTLPQLLVAESGGWISAWNLENGTEIARKKFEAVPENLAYSPNGELVAASYRTTNAWGVSIHKEDGSVVAQQFFSNMPSAVVWHPEAKQVAITDYGGFVHMMDAVTGRLQPLGQHKAQAATATFSPSGDYLVTGGWERELIFWDLRAGKPALTASLDGYIFQFRSDGSACALITRAGIQLFEFADPSAYTQLSPDLGPRLEHAAFSPDGRWLAAAADRRIGVWDLTVNTPAVIQNVDSETQLFWSNDSRELFGSSSGRNYYRWQIQPGAHPGDPPRLEPIVDSSALGLMSLCVASNQIVFTRSSGSRVSRPDRSDDTAWTSTASGISRASENARWFGIYRPYGQVLHVYALPGLAPVAHLTNQASIAGFSFSPSGDEIAVASRGQVEFWSTETWTRTRSATKVLGFPYIGVLYQPDGQSVWMHRDYNSPGLYHAQTLDPVLLLPGRMAPLALDRSGTKLAVSIDARALQLWDTAAVRKDLAELGLVSEQDLHFSAPRESFLSHD